MLNKLGFDKLELRSAAARRCLPKPWRSGRCWGVNVCEMYGQTETAGGIVAGQRGPFPRPGDVGTVPAGWEVKLADDGEMLVRGPDMFDGYWNNADATRAVIGDDGWLRTGDVGEWRDGKLRLIDRARDFLVTSGGKTISPSFIENALRASPYIARGDRVRPRPQISHRADRDRFRHRGRLGAQPRRGLHRLHQPGAASAAWPADPGAKSTRPTSNSRASSRSRRSASCPRRSIPRRKASR